MKDEKYLQILQLRIKQKYFWSVFGIPEVMLNYRFSKITCVVLLCIVPTF